MSTRDRIVAAAAEVLRGQGLARATTKQIARAADLSEAALYKHFPDKETLLLTVVHERLPQLIETLQRLPERVGQGSIERHLEELAVVAVAFYRQLVPMASSLFSEPELLARYQEDLRDRGLGPHLALQGLASYLAAEQRQGRVSPDVDPRAAAALLLGACFQRAFFATFVGPRSVPDDDTEFAVQAVASLVRGLAADR